MSLAPSSVLLCPVLGLSLASKTLATGLGLSLVPCPAFCWLGFVLRSMPQLCSLQSLVPSFQRYVRSRVHLLCSALCLQVVFWAWSLLLWVRFRPLPDNSLGCRSVCCDPPCGNESERVIPSLLGPSSSGVCHLSRVCSLVGGHVGVAHFFHPSLLLGGGLCPLLRWVVLAFSNYFLSVPSAIFFASVSWFRSHSIVAPLAPFLS